MYKVINRKINVLPYVLLAMCNIVQFMYLIKYDTFVWKEHTKAQTVKRSILIIRIDSNNNGF